MSEHELIHQEREILRAFRQTTGARVKAETDAEAQRKAELSAAETKSQNAQRQAEAERAKAEAEAKSLILTDSVVTLGSLPLKQTPGDFATSCCDTPSRSTCGLAIGMWTRPGCADNRAGSCATRPIL